MAVRGRRAPAAVDERPQRAPLKVLHADGQRIDLSKRDAATLLVATRPGLAVPGVRLPRSDR